MKLRGPPQGGDKAGSPISIGSISAQHLPDATAAWQREAESLQRKLVKLQSACTQVTTATVRVDSTNSVRWTTADG